MTDPSVPQELFSAAFTASDRLEDRKVVYEVPGGDDLVYAATNRGSDRFWTVLQDQCEVDLDPEIRRAVNEALAASLELTAEVAIAAIVNAAKSRAG